ncbi:MAG TPA: hypothetical protein VIJ42_17035 [Stellaceae bacterium]
MHLSVMRVAMASLLIVTVPAGTALAHAICGNRVFPPTLTLDDPGISDELSLPTMQFTPIPAAAGDPSGHDLGYGFEWDKTITPRLGIAIEGGYIVQRGAGQNAHGWDNLAVTLKGQILCAEEHEFMISAGVERDFNRTGSAQLRDAGIIDNIGATTPTLYAGKGLGDLPIGWLRPLAITGTLGYEISDSPGASPDQWDYAVSLQYSLPYLQQHVRALDMPAFFGRLIPLVEFAYSAPRGGPTTGTISPGLLYEADTWQVGAEAIIPVNRATRQIQGTGFIVQFHLFLDDLLPNSIGKPLFD